MRLPRSIDELGSTAFCVIPDFFSSTESALIGAEIETRYREGAFRRAGVGQGNQHRLADSIRRDEICWLEPTRLSPPEELLWSRLEELRLAINRRLLLGLWELEGHFAVYPEGAFYGKHLDRFLDDDSRVISVVAYFNEDWRAGDGGELRIYPAAAEPREISPAGGTLVAFLSDQLPHEVLASSRRRKSFAGWFRVRGA